MTSNLPTIMVRTQKETIEKLRIISAENNRSMSKEVEFLIKIHIKKYELEHGPIEIKLEE